MAIEHTRPIVIEPSHGWRRLKLHELWDYRELLYFFVWRDVKVRYKQTALGAAWAVLQPFMLMVVFGIFLGRLAGVPSEGLPYPVFAYVGLVPWLLFAQGLSAASESLVGNAQVISKVYFPRLIVPVAAASSFVLDFLIASTLLIGMMFVYDVHPNGAAIALPALVSLALLTAYACGIGLAALNVRYRDVRYAVPFLIQLWLFASPVAYPASLVPERWQLVYGLNPMAGVVEGFRWALLGTGDPPGAMLAVSVGVTLVLLAASVTYFQRMERTFADVI
jgi:lipopolysaccharide transport system permease protein